MPRNTNSNLSKARVFDILGFWNPAPTRNEHLSILASKSYFERLSATVVDDILESCSNWNRASSYSRVKISLRQQTFREESTRQNHISRLSGIAVWSTFWNPAPTGTEHFLTFPLKCHFDSRPSGTRALDSLESSQVLLHYLTPRVKRIFQEPSTNTNFSKISPPWTSRT